MRPSLRLLAAVGTLLTLLGLGIVGAALRVPATVEPTVEARVPPLHPELWPTWLDRVAQHEERRDVLLGVGDGFLAVSRSELGFSVDRRRALESLTTSRIKRGFLASVMALRSPFETHQAAGNLTLPWSFDRGRARAFLQSLAPRVDIAPQNAKVDFARHEAEPSQPGRQLDIEPALEMATSWGSSTPRDVLELTFTRTAPSVELTDLTPVDPRKVLAVFETDFSKKRGPRVSNIRRAARLLDGAVLPPGDILSFNRRVGRRVAQRGFVDAPVIVNDEMESGMGGGVCQVATTLHAAAVYGGLEVKERRSHSRPSGYASLGLDATVIDGVQDLKLQNPYAVPIYVRAYLPSRFVVRVELLGAELEGVVKHSYRVLERHAFSRRIVEKPDLAPGTFKVSQKGSFGYDTVSSVILTDQNGRRRERRYKSKYYPVPEVLWVGPGTRPTDLPPPPEDMGTSSL